MAKMKSNRGAAKRFKVCANGRLKRGKAYRRHILTKKSTKTKRQLRVADRSVHPADQASVKAQLSC